MKLKDVYIAYDKRRRVRVVPKTDGVPCDDKHGWKASGTGYYDYSDWPDLTPAEFFLEQFTSLTCGGCKPQQVDDEFSKIDEYEALDDKAFHTIRRTTKRELVNFIKAA
jgi:hypothetical protein